MEIIRIISIVDTREYEEQGDRWVPIPGSGDRSVCARCKREHEVHATVELADGSTVVVGTGCAARESVELAAEFKRGDSRAKKLAAQRAKVARMEALVAELNTMKAEVNALTPPAVTISDLGDNRVELECGDAKIRRWFMPFTRNHYAQDELALGEHAARENERQKFTDAAVSHWRHLQTNARGITQAHRDAAMWLHAERNKLADMERGAI